MDCDLERRRFSTLIHLNSQDVAGGKGSVVDPNMPVTVKIQHRLAKFLSGGAQRCEEVRVFILRIRVPKEHQAGGLIAKLSKIAADPLQPIGVPLSPFGRVMNESTNDIDAHKQNMVLQEGKMFFMFQLTKHGE